MQNGRLLPRWQTGKNNWIIYEYDILNDTGTISAKQAKEKAYAEYDKFRLTQDKEYFSNFDKEVKLWKEKGLFDKD